MMLSETSFPLEITLSDSRTSIGLLTFRLLETRLLSVISRCGTALLEVEIDVEEQWLGEMAEHLAAAGIERITFSTKLVFRERDSTAVIKGVQVIIERCSIPNSLPYTIFLWIDGKRNDGPCETIYDALIAVSSALGLHPEVCGDCKYCELSPYGNMSDFFQGVCHGPKRPPTDGSEHKLCVSTFHVCELYAAPRPKVYRRP